MVRGILLLVTSAAVLASGYPTGPSAKEAEELPPTPFEYKFTVDRTPGGKPDRYVKQKGDEHGVVEGSYTYLGPDWKWHKTEYVADEEGFHVLPGSTPVEASLPEETPVVAAARAKHEELFAAIAARNEQVAVSGNAETAAVAAVRAEHAQQFAAIAAEHARIGEAHRRDAAEEEEKRRRAELYRTEGGGGRGRLVKKTRKIRVNV